MPSRLAFGLLAAFALALAGCGGGSDSPLTPGPAGGATTKATDPTSSTDPATSTAAAASPTAAPTISVGGVNIGPLVERPPTPLDGLAVIIESGCWQCDGPTEGLVRLYVDPAGVTRNEPLLREPLSGSRGLTDYLVAKEGGELWLGVCDVGFCGLLGFPSEDAQVTLHRSIDGGVSWRPIETVDGAAYPVELDATGLVTATYAPAPGGPVTLARLPSGDPVNAPPGSGGLAASLAGGTLVWFSADRRALLRSDGSDYFRAPAGGTLTAIAAHPTEERLAVSVFVPRADGAGPGLSVLAIVERGDARAVFNATETSLLLVWGWLDDDIILGNRAGTASGALPEPILIDWRSGSYSRLEGPFASNFSDAGEDLLAGRNFFVAAQRGPFARVAADGECLNVRTEPSTSAVVLGCFADGVLFQTEGRTDEGSDLEWLAVTTPAGGAGWAATEFLEFAR